MHRVAMNRRYGVYNAGEVASFPAPYAALLEKAGVARDLGPAEPAPESPATEAEKQRRPSARARAD